ncbi:MAG: hypothetical protein U1E84_03170 [Rhodoferax sp.]
MSLDLADALLNEHRMLLELARAQAPVPAEALGSAPAKAPAKVTPLPVKKAAVKAVAAKAPARKTTRRKAVETA